MVQHGDCRQLVAGSYIILAATWASLGGVVALAGVVIEATAKTGVLGSALLVAGGALLTIGFLRQVQSRNARRRGDP
jgi:hypothetical protein